MKYRIFNSKLIVKGNWQLKTQGIIEYLDQIGVKLPEAEETATEEEVTETVEPEVTK